MKTGRVYKVITRESNDIYLGSTFNELRYRLTNHKMDYKQYKNGGKTHYMSSYELFDNYGVDNCKIVLIKEYSVCDRKHLMAYEQLWINKLKPINKTSSFRIKWLYQKLYHKENKEILLKKKRQYYQENKDRIKDRDKKYQEVNKDKIKERTKKYRETNRETLAQKNREWREANKEKDKEKKKEYYEKIEKERRKGYCIDCDKHYNHIKEHYKTILHLKHVIPLEY
jgi:hypothetical protein